MPRAAGQELVDDSTMGGVVAAVPACCPADHLELVIVALTDDVSTSVGQPSNDIDMTGSGGPVQGAGVVGRLTRIDVEAAREKQIDRVQVPIVSRDMKQRPLVRFIASVKLFRVLVQESAKPGDIAGQSRVKQLLIDVWWIG